MLSKIKNLNLYLSLLLLLILTFTIPLTKNLIEKPQNIRSKAEEVQRLAPQSKERPKPEFTKGEVIIKLKVQSAKLKVKEEKKNQGVDIEKGAVSFDDLDETSVPTAVKDIHSKYKIQRIEKVFKGTEEPEKELNKFKNKFAKEIQEGKRKINEQEYLKVDLSRVYKIKVEQEDQTEIIVKELSQKEGIEYAEPNFIYAIAADPNDPYFLDRYPDQVQNRDPNWNPPHDYQWNIKKTNSSNNWQVDTSNVTVAVIDTGVDVNHPDLGNVWINEGEIAGDSIDNDQNGCVDDINGCRFIYWSAGGGDIIDDNGHGSHVAGIISAKTNNDLGIAGVTSNTKIMAVKALDQDGAGLSDGVSQGIIYAVNNGARVMNMSLSGNYSSTLKDALDLSIASNVIPVVAAGNGNNYSASVDEFPASYLPAITVSGVDEELNKMKYSNYGPNIDVAAPGGGKPCEFRSKPSYCSNVLSLKSSLDTFEPELVVGGNYLRLSGTSMATPHVAGVIALLLSQHPEFTLQNIDNYIRFNSIDTQGMGHNEKTGWGVINSAGMNFIPPSNIDFIIISPAENSITGKKFNIGGIIKSDNFDRYEITYRKKGTIQWQTEGVDLVNAGKSQVIPVDSMNVAKAGTITLPDSASLGVYEVKIIMFMTNGKSLSATRAVNYLQKPTTNWLNNGDDLNKPRPASILISDLNYDGYQEIILYQYEDFGNGGMEVFDYKYNSIWKTDLIGEAVVGDLDKRNNSREIVLATADKIYIYNPSGQVISDMTLNTTVNSFSNVMILDSDKNDVDELYFYDKYNVLHAYEQKGDYVFSEKWRYSSKSSNTYAWPIGGDLNGDGLKEIVTVSPDEKIVVLDNRGQQVGVGSIGGGGYFPDRMALADFDLDGKEELVIHVQWGDTKMFKLIGSSLNELWAYNNSRNADTLTVADFNNDTYPDIYTQINMTSQEDIIDRNGKVLYKGTSDLYFGSSDNGGVVLADRDNNNLVEVNHVGLYGLDYRDYLHTREYDKSSNQLNYIDGEWKVVLPQWNSFSEPYGFETGRAVAITDLDNNNKLDLVISGVGIIEYETTGMVYWPHRYHDFQRTGSYNFKPKVIILPTLTPSPTPTLTPTPTPTPFTVGGLIGLYYNNLTFATPAALLRYDPTLSFSWGTTSPDLKVRVDAFSVRWLGKLRPQHTTGTETYTFYTKTDDGVRVWVNSQLIIDKWQGTGLREASGTAQLTAGVKTPIRIDYYDLSGNAQIELKWSSPSIPLQLILADSLTPSEN